MSQPTDITSPSTPGDAATASSSNEETGARDPGTSQNTTTSSPEAAHAPAAGGDAPSASAGDHDGDADGDHGDGEPDGDHEGEGAEAGSGEGAAAGAPGEGTPAKRKRRRRRKKKPVGEGVQGAEGAAAGAPPVEGAHADGKPGPHQGQNHGGQNHGQRGQGPGKHKKKDFRPERERPAFNVGDVVFGKVLEVTEDVLFVDLSGKAKAIFDLRELLITEDEAEEYDRAHRREEEERRAEQVRQAAAKAASAGPGDATQAAEASEAPSAEAQDAPAALEAAPEPAAEAAPEPAAEATETVAVEAPSPETHEAIDNPLAATGENPAVDVAHAAAATDEKPQLPKVVLEPGAPFVGLVHNDGGRGGLVVLTHHPKRMSKSKPVLADASRSGALVFGLVTGTIKGGVEVDVDGLRAFAPASHVELRPGADLSYLVGRRLPFAVTQYAKRGRDVVLSRRAMLEGEAKEKREKALATLEMGSVVDGIVRTVVPFGAFVDVGGVEGLVPLSEMSHNRADQPRDLFKVNDTCRVKILRVDEKGKLWLSRRAAIEDPWAHVAEKYAPGTRHKGKVARLQPFGAFIELETGIDGLIHTVDLSVKRIEHPEEVVKIGDEIDVVVASVDSRAHRVALHPAPSGEAANETPQRVQLNKSVKVVVVGIENNAGLTVRVLGATGRQARGFISASATGTPRGTELKKLFPVGKELDAKIIEHDPRRGELKLSIRALNEETERNAYQQYRAQVKREAKFGTLADLLAKRNITPNK
jgi:small subunit ribosomal protein S1